MLDALLIATALASSLLLYGASRHCLWTGLHTRVKRFGRLAGALLALVSFGCAFVAYGASAGLCIMLAAWMLGLAAWPYLAWATHRRTTR